MIYLFFIIMESILKIVIERYYLKKLNQEYKSDDTYTSTLILLKIILWLAPSKASSSRINCLILFMMIVTNSVSIFYSDNPGPSNLTPEFYKSSVNTIIIIQNLNIKLKKT